MAKYFLISLIVALVVAPYADSKPAYQMLESKPGYIPVYIRFGDQPLEEINPLLAEAFKEHEISARNIKTEAQPGQNVFSFSLLDLLPSPKQIGDFASSLPDPRAFIDKRFRSDSDSKSSSESSGSNVPTPSSNGKKNRE